MTAGTGGRKGKNVVEQTVWGRCRSVFLGPRLKPRKIIFPEYEPEAWARGDHRSAARDLSVDKLVSWDLGLLAPEVEEFLTRILPRFHDRFFFPFGMGMFGWVIGSFGSFGCSFVAILEVWTWKLMRLG